MSGMSPYDTERWLDKRGLAAHLSCSVRSVETALSEGMPSTRIFGRPKFKASEAEVWLEEHGYMTRPDNRPLMHTERAA